MNVLVVNVFNPPLLCPQSIQIGGLLHSLSMLPAIKLNVFGLRFPLGDKKLDCFEGYADLFNSYKLYELKSDSKSIFSKLKRFIPVYEKRPDRYLNAQNDIYKDVEYEIKKNNVIYDIIISFGDPMSSHIIGSKLSVMYNIPHVCHFSDPWSWSPYTSKNPIDRYVNRYLERRVFNNAGLCVFTSVETENRYKNIYENMNGMVLNHSSSLKPQISDDQSNEYVIRYIGSLYGKRNPINLLKAIRDVSIQGVWKLKDGRDIRLELVGPVSPFIKLKMKLLSLDKYCTQIGAVDYSKSLEYIKKSNLLLVIDANVSSSVFFPSKLVDYLCSGRPILGIVPEGCSKRVILQYGGLVCNSLKNSDIKNELMKIIDTPPSANTYNYSDEEFSFSRNAEKLYHALKMVRDSNV